jgi:hypothetical protein
MHIRNCDTLSLRHRAQLWCAIFRRGVCGATFCRPEFLLTEFSTMRGRDTSPDTIRDSNK